MCMKIRNGEGPGKETLNFWGRVKDWRGNYIEGALIMLLATINGEEVCLGHTYSNKHGFYLISIYNEQKLSAGDCRILAGMGVKPSVYEGFNTGHYCFYPSEGKAQYAVEFQIINYYLLTVIADRDSGPISIEAIPESLRVSFFRERHTGVQVCGIKGRGYLKTDAEVGDGEFHLTVCTIGEGINEQEMLRLTIVPEEKKKKSLFYDSGSKMTVLFC